MNFSVLIVHTNAEATSTEQMHILFPYIQILSTSGWSSASTFAYKLCNKPVDVCNGIAEYVLKSVAYEIFVTYTMQTNKSFYYPTSICRVQIMPTETSTNTTRYKYVLQRTEREVLTG